MFKGAVGGIAGCFQITNLAAGIEDSIHRADRAEVDALVEQGCVDFGRREVSEAGRAVKIENVLTQSGRQRPLRAWPMPRRRPPGSDGDSFGPGWRGRDQARHRWPTRRRGAAGLPPRPLSGACCRARSAPAESPAKPPIFSDRDDPLGAFQAALELGVFPQCSSQVRGQRIGLARLRPAFGRRERTQRPGITLPAPFR